MDPARGEKAGTASVQKELRHHLRVVGRLPLGFLPVHRCKVYLADALTCRKCGGALRIIAFIDDPPVIEKILRHLKLWDTPERPPPRRRSRTPEPDEDFLAWEARGRLLDGID